MNSPLVLAIVGLVGILLTAVFTYLGTKRKGSGSIKTSEAADLWGQTQALLSRYAEEIKTATAETVALRKELAEVRAELGAVRDQLARIQASGAVS